MWNIRGFNSPMKYGDVKWFVEHHSIGLLGLLETRVRSHNFPKVFARFGGRWSIATNYVSHKGGRIWLLWWPSYYSVDIVKSTAQLIHSEVIHRSSGRKWWVTVVYGFNEASERSLLWAELKDISKKISGAWVVGGDWNNVLHLNERVGSAITFDEVFDFRQCLRNCQLQEQKNFGSFYT